MHKHVTFCFLKRTQCPSPTSFMNGPLMEMYTYLIQFTLSALVKLSNLNFSFIISARQFVALSLKLKINKLLFLNWGILKNVVHYTYRFLIVSTSDKHFKLSLNNLRTRFSNSDLKLHFIFSIWTKCEKKFPTGLEIWISKLQFNNRTCIICIELKWMFEPILSHPAGVTGSNPTRNRQTCGVSF